MQFNHSQLLKNRHILIGEKDENCEIDIFISDMLLFFCKGGYSMEKINGMENVGLCSEATQLSSGSSSFNISWLGTSGSTNSASVEVYYGGGSLGGQVVVTGTPTWGTACVISFIPTNCMLASGESKVSISILGANLGTTFLTGITPNSSYGGTTVRFSVTINGASGAVLYASGGVG